MTTDSPFARILAHALEVKADLETRLERLAVERPEWITSVDARAAGFQDLLNTLRYAELSLVFIETCLNDSQWWTSLRCELPSIRRVEFEYTAYSSISRFAVSTMAASTCENTLRGLLRAIAPGVAKDARGEFKSVYEALLRSQLGFPDRDIQLLDLVRLTRNTMHNTGVHKPPSRRSEVVVLNGIEYKFDDGAPVEFSTWDFCLDQVVELQSLLDRVVRSDRVWNHPDAIPADWVELG